MESLILDLITRLYESVGDPKQWPSPAFLEKCADAIHSIAVNIVALDYAARSASIDVSFGVDEYWKKAYPYFADRNVWMHRGRPLFLRQGCVVASSTIVSDQELVVTEYYNDFLRPQGVFYACAAVKTEQESRVRGITAWRSKAAGDFTQEQLALVERLLPHIQKVAALHRRVASLEEKLRLADKQIARASGRDRRLPYGRLVDKVTHHPAGDPVMRIPVRTAPLPDFTPAESRLAAALVTGMTLQEFAESAGIVYDTARGTLKKIFSKSGVTRQTDLVRVLITSGFTHKN